MVNRRRATDVPPRVARSVWRNRDFLLLWSGQAISTIGTTVSTLAAPLLVLALTRSPTEAGLIAATKRCPILCSPCLPAR